LQLLQHCVQLQVITYCINAWFHCDFNFGGHEFRVTMMGTCNLYSKLWFLTTTIDFVLCCIVKNQFPSSFFIYVASCIWSPESQPRPLKNCISLFSTCVASYISTLKTPYSWIFSSLFNLCYILHFNLDYQT